jgi:malonate decarboxylase beta subunit
MLESIAFSFNLKGMKTVGVGRCVCGVVGSGNLEVIIEANNTLDTQFYIQTTVAHYRDVWQAVINDFVNDYQLIGLKFIINDNGATPPVVSLRLRQALELYQGYQSFGACYLELGARERIVALVDDQSFVEWLPGAHYSPHLAVFELPAQADDGIIIGKAQINQQSILIASQQKDFMGGGVGEIHGAKLTGLFKAATRLAINAVILLIDSGGVRLQEANAGEIAISETIRAIFDARSKGIVTIGIVCGKNGAFGGMGILAASLDYLVVNEIGRLGVSGPEVIQAVKGIDAFDAQDRALVWRVYGGKTRFIQNMAQVYVGSTIDTIKTAIVKILLTQSTLLTMTNLCNTHQLLKTRLANATACNAQEEGMFLRQYHPTLENIFDLDDGAFLAAVAGINPSIEESL